MQLQLKSFQLSSLLRSPACYNDLMKILATSDTHGNLDKLNFDGIDVVCFAGDIAPLKGHSKWDVYEQKKWMQKKFCAMAAMHPDKQFVFVPGNHDFFPIAADRFGRDINWKIEWPENVHMLIDSEIEISGIKFYGSPWVPIINYCWAFEADNDILKQRFARIPDRVDVLLTHSPPHLESDYIDRSLQFGISDPFGSYALTEAIFDKQPKLAFCGHIHTGLHTPIQVGSTTCVNVSRVDENYEIAYEPYVCEVFPQA